MVCLGNRIPEQKSFEDTIKFLTWEQFPVILEEGIRHFKTLPQVGKYSRQVNNSIESFDRAILSTTTRDYTISGVGSLINYDEYGHQLKRPTPQLQGTGCNANSLCIEPTCFGFTEGVIESNNILQNICWSLDMKCLKDHFYSDRKFDDKMETYFEMFFHQPPAVLEAYLRTRLLKEAIKIVATDRNFRFTGPVIGGQSGISLPFYVDPFDPTAMPNVNNINANVGGINLMAFVRYLVPSLFSNAFEGGMQSVTVYGLPQDFDMAREQTASVQDHYLEQSALSSQLDSILGANVVEDNLFPTLKLDTLGQFEFTPFEILEPSTIAGYQQVHNPEHSLNQFRAILLVPSNWKFNMVEPPRDDFSNLGLGPALNFRMNTPGVMPILSSSIFANNRRKSRQVILGQTMGPGGMMIPSSSGLERRARAVREAVRTEVLLTYSTISCNDSIVGQLPNVGQQIVPQNRADGFELKSTMYVGSDVMGIARPVLVIFKIDTPRSARPVEVCSVEEVDITTTPGNVLVDCCPGNQQYVLLTFRNDVSADFAVNDTVVYRTGARGSSYLATVTAVTADGRTVTIQSDDQSILPCCTGSPDDYGVRGVIVNTTNATATSSEIFKAGCNNPNLLIELFDPIVDTLDAAPGTITLENGDVINVVTVGAGSGVVLEVAAAGGETCVLCDLDCSCLVNALFELVIP